jgi:hypothetical protein
MNRATGRSPSPAPPAAKRALQIAEFYDRICVLEQRYKLRIAGDGLEIHDATTPGRYPAIITEDGDLEIFRPARTVEEEIAAVIQ